MSPLTGAEVQRLLTLLEEPEEQQTRGWHWSCFRRRHQAGAQSCHQARRAGRRLLAPGGPAIRELDSGAVELTDERWARVVDLLPVEGRPGRDAPAYRAVLTAILWVMHTSRRWEDLPVEWGAWSAVYTRYKRWRDSGLWQRILDALHADQVVGP